MSVDTNENRPEEEMAPVQEDNAGTENVSVTTEKETEEEASFESLLEAYEGKTQSFSEGEVIKGEIIAISGGGRISANDWLKLAQAFGADIILSKPFRPNELLEAISSLLN